MSVIYPLHFHRRVDRLWTSREKNQRSAPVFTTIDRRRGSRCECGRSATAPSMSVYVRSGSLNIIGHAAVVGGSGVSSTAVPLGSVAIDAAE